MPIAYFDIDKTIISVNSAKLWLKYEMRRGSISKRTALRGLAWAGLYGVGVADVTKLLYEAVGQLKGRHEATLRADTETFFAREIRHTIRPGAMRTINLHRDRGDAIVLLTSSSNYIAAEVSRALHCDAFLSNAFEVEGGHFTGNPIEPLCYHAGKIEHARALADSYGESLDAATFYTDSFTDLPMMEAVGTPVAVHPDPRLLREARMRGWDVQNWDS